MDHTGLNAIDVRARSRGTMVVLRMPSPLLARLVGILGLTHVQVQA